MLICKQQNILQNIIYVKHPKFNTIRNLKTL
jgi:hypothetical protein